MNRMLTDYPRVSLWPIEWLEEKISLWMRAGDTLESFLWCVAKYQHIFLEENSFNCVLSLSKMRIQFSENIPAKLFHFGMGTATMVTRKLDSGLVWVIPSGTLGKAADPLASPLTSIKCGDWLRSILWSLPVPIFWKPMLPPDSSLKENHVSSTCFVDFE